MLFVFMIIDGLSPPVGIKTMNVRIDNGNLDINATFETGYTKPILLWPKSQDWVNPCKQAKNLCCLKEVNDQYQNDMLQSIQGTECLTSIPNNMVTNSRTGVQSTKNSFHATVPRTTKFVAMLFVQDEPFKIFEGFHKINIQDALESATTFELQNNPCYSVAVPGTMISVCMQCHNKLPSNAYYVWTPNWYVNFYCSWECHHNYLKSDTNCILPENGIPLLPIILGGVFAVAVLILCIFLNIKILQSKPERKELDSAMKTTSDISYITFKDDMVFDTSRFKLQ
jgi:hypothetical protein